MLTVGEPEMRLAAVTALTLIGSPGAMQMLERALIDEDREVRIVAVRALGARNARAALPRIASSRHPPAIRDRRRSLCSLRVSRSVAALLEQRGKPLPRAKEKDLDAVQAQAEGRGDFAMARPLDVREPQQLAIARTQLPEQTSHVDLERDVAAEAHRLWPIPGLYLVFVPPPVVDHQIACDPK